MNLPLNNSMLRTKNERNKDLWSSLAWVAIIYVISQLILGVLSALVIIIISSYTGIDYTTISQSNTFNTLFTLYGSLIMTIFTIQVSVMLENRSYKSLGVSKTTVKVVLKYFAYGIIFALIIILFQMFIGQVQFTLNTDRNSLIMIAFIFGLLIKAASDNLLYRGYLMNALSVDNNISMALFLSSVVATIPTLLSNNFTLVSVLNTFLFQLMLAIIFYLTDNVVLTTIFSFGWSLVHYGIFGSPLNSQSVMHALMSYDYTNATVFSGNEMGIIGSLYSTFILLIGIFILYRQLRLISDESK